MKTDWQIVAVFLFAFAVFVFEVIRDNGGLQRRRGR
jgi:hypothetical protein